MNDPEKAGLLFLNAKAPPRTSPKQFFTRALARKLGAELIGTYFLTTVVAVSDHAEFPAASGFALAGLVYALGHISGAHLNPAVTAAVSGVNKMDGMTALAYVAAQVSGAFVAGVQQRLELEDVGLDLSFPSIMPNASLASAFVSELTMTMALALVVLNVVATKSQENNMFFGTAIGLTFAAASNAASLVSDGCLNPAIGIALPAVAGEFSDIWLYVLAPVLGGFLAALVFTLTVDPAQVKQK